MIPKSHFNLLLALSLFFLSFLAYIYVTQQYQIQLLQYQLLKLQSPAPVPSPTPSPTSSSDTSTTQTYKNDKYGFEFQYPNSFLIAQVVNPYYYLDNQIIALQNQYPETKTNINFNQDASITVSYNQDLKNCLIFKETNNPITKIADINGTRFFKTITGGIATSNRYQQEIYRTIKGNLCLEVSLMVHQSTDYNSISIEDINLMATAAMNDLNQILSTFKFTN